MCETSERRLNEKTVGRNRTSRRIKAVLITGAVALSDFIALAAIMVLAGAARQSISPWYPIDLHAEMYLEVLMAFLVLPAAYAAVGLYPGYGQTTVERLRKRTLTTMACFAAMILFDYLAQNGQWSRGLLLTAGAITLFVGPIWESATRHFLRSNGWWGEPVVVFGPADKCQPIIEALRQHDDLGWIPVAQSDLPSADAPAIAGVSLALVVPRNDSFKILSLAENLPYERVVLIPDMGGGPTLWVSVRDLDARLGLEMRRNLLRPTSQAVKRAMDILFGGIALVLSVPIILVFALLVFVRSPGPVFFRQRRLGRNHIPFLMWKLRSMRPDAEEILAKVMRETPGAQREWDETHKLRHDPRIVPVVGQVMRRFSIDELPQFWNVLRGDMSLVGPRPLPQYHIDSLDPEAIRFRALVRPGITGLWQVSGRSDVAIAGFQNLDAYYLRNWSLWLDIYILARTVVVLLNGRGAR